jgi:hypothetical protein
MEHMRKSDLPHCRISAIFLISLALTACAPMVPTAPVTFIPHASTKPAPELHLTAAVEVPVGPGYKRTLAANSRWRMAGTVPQGDVYRPGEGVFTIEGRQVHEAYLVVARRALVGFYLPAESRYSPLSAPINLTLGETQ